MFQSRRKLKELLKEKKEQSEKLRAHLSEFFPDQTHWKWRDDEDQQAILEFDAVILKAEPERRQAHLAFLDYAMSRDDIALIIKNMIDLNKEVWNGKSILQNLKRNGYRHHKYFRYKPCTTEEHTTGFPFKFQRVVTNITDLEEMISQFEERDNNNNNSGKAEQSKGFLYMKDLSFQDHCPSLAKEFRDNCRIPEILPEGGWCLMRSVVSCSGRTYVGVCTLLSANVLALYLWIGPASRLCLQQLCYGVLIRSRRW